MKYLTALAITLFFSLNSMADVPDKKLHNLCLYPTVMIYSTEQEATGSGVIIESVKKEDKYRNTVLTCSHIFFKSPPKVKIEGDEAILIEKAGYKYDIRVGIYKNWSRLVGSETYTCEIGVLDPVFDLAIVHFYTDKKQKVAILNLDPKVYIGSKVLKFGCGLGESFRLDRGEITSLDSSIGVDPKMIGLYRISAPAICGDSGGPLFNIAYENVAIVKLIRTYPVGDGNDEVEMPLGFITYAIPVKRILLSPPIREYLKADETLRNFLPKDKEDLLEEIMNELEEELEGKKKAA